ncbi:MAG TPA: hypothetical protein ENJ53_09015 [Phaeodactylibacter sp.]|nr:hypothetical protein [Phaeodactylibacter sp.]
MEIIEEFFIELIFRRIIVGVFGYYTLLAFYKVTNNREGLKWLEEPAAHEGEEFGKGCLISMVGLISFSGVIILIAYLFY